MGPIHGEQATSCRDRLGIDPERNLPGPTCNSGMDLAWPAAPGGAWARGAASHALAGIPLGTPLPAHRQDQRSEHQRAACSIGAILLNSLRVPWIARISHEILGLRHGLRVMSGPSSTSRLHRFNGPDLSTPSAGADHEENCILGDPGDCRCCRRPFSPLD